MLVWIGIALAVVAGVYLVLTLTGALLPRRVTGTALFIKELRKYDIDPAKVEPAFVSALIEQCEKISIAGRYMAGESQITYFRDLVLRAAHSVASVIKGQGVSEDDPAVRLARSMLVRENYGALDA